MTLVHILTIKKYCKSNSAKSCWYTIKIKLEFQDKEALRQLGKGIASIELSNKHFCWRVDDMLVL